MTYIHYSEVGEVQTTILQKAVKVDIIHKRVSSDELAQCVAMQVPYSCSGSG